MNDSLPDKEMLTLGCSQLVKSIDDNVYIRNDYHEKQVAELDRAVEIAIRTENFCDICPVDSYEKCKKLMLTEDCHKIIKEELIRLAKEEIDNE
jgi:7-cyano-7-deazaguanine synthase in queuosine biosynthesis